jgi:Amiloride-sensitive sodium channel
MAAIMDWKDETSDDGEIFYLLYYYLTLATEQRIQSLDYDFGNFLVAAGGNLGLFLGMSCLSVLWSLADFLQAIARNFKK